MPYAVNIYKSPNALNPGVPLNSPNTREILFAMVFILTVIYSLFSASHVVAQDYAFRTRQIPGTMPSQCNAACQTIFSISASCAQDVVYCSCTPTAGAAEQTCISCLTAVDPGGMWDAALTAYGQVCSNAGKPFDPPLSITAWNVAATSTLETGYSSGTPGTQSSAAPSATQGFRSINTTVNVNDPRIIISGPDWKNSTSSCDSSVVSKENNVANQMLTFKFTGTAVFMSTAQTDTSGKYSVTLDNQTAVAIDCFQKSQNPSCEFGWSAVEVQNSLHTVVVTTMGQSSEAASGVDASNFELDGFVITQTTANSGASSDTLLNFNLGSGFHQFIVFMITALVVILNAR